MDTVTVAILSGIGSGILGAFLTSIIAPRINSYFERVNERRKILNKTLNFLLRLHYQAGYYLTAFEESSFARQLKRKLLAEGAELSEINEIFGMLKATGKLNYHTMKLPLNVRKTTTVEFRQIMDELAKFEPVLAFEMHTHHVHDKSLEEIEGGGVAGQTANDDEFAHRTYETLSPKKYTELESDINMLALKLGKRKWKETKKSLNTMWKISDKNIRELIETTWEEYYREDFLKILNAIRTMNSTEKR